MENTKTCTKCKECKPATTEFFQGNGDKLRNQCRKCCNERRREKYIPAPPKVDFIVSDSGPIKQCNLCKEWKPATDEYFYKYTDRFRASCKVCCNLNSKQWRENNKERALEFTRNYRKRKPENVKASKLKYRSKPEAKCKEKEYRIYYKDTCGDTQREAVRRWSANHRDYRRRQSHERRSVMNNLPATYTEKEWNDCLEYWQYRCAYCGCVADSDKILAQEHFIPVTKDGPYTANNILPACHGIGGCNNSKHNVDPIEWLYRTHPSEQADLILARINIYFQSIRDNDEFNS